MYTDTKNLANLCVNNTNASAKILNHQQDQQPDDKFKLRKVWKPILRLMSLKSSASSTAKTNRSIPNNVNLNNAQTNIIKNTPKDLLVVTTESSENEEEDEQCLHTQKLPEFCQRRPETTEPTATATQSLEFISRVSVEKTPLNTCNNCAYGRNCQHSQYHQQLDTPNAHNLQSSPLQQQQQNQPQGDFNFITAEDGCFVWSDTCGDIDEQLLRQWFWQNSWQFAENATVC